MKIVVPESYSLTTYFAKISKKKMKIIFIKG